jgi:type I restriction enzyme S subunit
MSKAPKPSTPTKAVAAPVDLHESTSTESQGEFVLYTTDDSLIRRRADRTQPNMGLTTTRKASSQTGIEEGGAIRLTPNEVGRIPDGWTVKSLGEICERVTNGFVGVAAPYYVEEGAGVRYLLGTNIRPNQITSKTKTFIARDFSEKNEKSILRRGDLLTVQSGHIGVTAVVPDALIGSNCHALIISRLHQDQGSPGFISQYLNSPIGLVRLKGLHVGSSVPHINTSELAKFKIPLPPLAEQRQIADTFATWDQAIATTKRMLANSQRCTRDLMASMLSGRRRFPEFSEKWRYADLDNVFERVTQKNSVHNTNVLTISAEHGLISQRDYFNKSVASADLSGYTLLRRNDFAYNKSYSAGYPMGAIKPLLAYESGVVSSLYVCLRLREDVDADFDFFRHYFEAGLLNQEIEGIAQEGARNHGLLNVSVTDFFKLQLHIPKAPEQRRIAAVINIARAEEARLEAQVQALRQEKIVLMDQKQTGKRRVKPPEAETKA